MRQPWLFVAKGQLSERLGAGIFAEIPASPGVYRFYDEDDRLLYIGQSSNLRARVGSYRHVADGSHPRRVVRMAARIRRLEWERCETAAEAVETERVLLLEHAPPFNRAGVWLPPPWWMQLEETAGRLHARLTRKSPANDAAPIGPLPSSFRFTFAALMRCAYRWHWPETTCWSLPCGMARSVIPPDQVFPLSDRSAVSADTLRDFVITGNPTVLEAMLAGIEEMPETAEGTFWAGDADALRKYARRLNHPVSGHAAPAAPGSHHSL